MLPPPPSGFLIFQGQRSDTICNIATLAWISLERWKLIIDFIVQQIAMVRLICKQGGGDNDADTVIGGGGLLL